MLNEKPADRKAQFEELSAQLAKYFKELGGVELSLNDELTSILDQANIQDLTPEELDQLISSSGGTFELREALEDYYELKKSVEA